MKTKEKEKIKRPMGRPIGSGGDPKDNHTLSFRPRWWAKVVKAAFKDGKSVNEYLEGRVSF